MTWSIISKGEGDISASTLEVGRAYNAASTWRVDLAPRAGSTGGAKMASLCNETSIIIIVRKCADGPTPTEELEQEAG